MVFFIGIRFGSNTIGLKSKKSAGPSKKTVDQDAIDRNEIIYRITLK